ncbi:thioesterase [Pollutimonas nitritireducens]|uniref:Thioesterase n=1 Tax=Pollutimonas nitritireducens TaxID=2045209 RepID=A0A2N4UEE2_9BURK|nr:PaaI family thioesterase [Pollutimonas nitritireducens]PLC53375.1 thioesterase [Pollutimonas nitritireducens]
MTQIPDGYRERVHNSEFTDLCGPFFEKIEDGKQIELALRISRKHSNLRGITHGGLLVTIADSAIGDAVAQAYGDEFGLVTVSLTSEFYRPAKMGDWVVARASVQKQGRRMAFADCFLYVDDEKIFRATGVFAIVERQGGR